MQILGWTENRNSYGELVWLAYLKFYHEDSFNARKGIHYQKNNRYKGYKITKNTKHDQPSGTQNKPTYIQLIL